MVDLKVVLRADKRAGMLGKLAETMVVLMVVPTVVLTVVPMVDLRVVQKEVKLVDHLVSHLAVQ